MVSDVFTACRLVRLSAGNMMPHCLATRCSAPRRSRIQMQGMPYRSKKEARHVLATKGCTSCQCPGLNCLAHITTLPTAHPDRTAGGEVCQVATAVDR